MEPAIRNFGSGSRRQFNFGSSALDYGSATLICGKGITRQINIVYSSNLVNARKVARVKRHDGNGFLNIADFIRVEGRGIR